MPASVVQGSTVYGQVAPSSSIVQGSAVYGSAYTGAVQGSMVSHGHKTLRTSYMPVVNYVPVVE